MFMVGCIQQDSPKLWKMTHHKTRSSPWNRINVRYLINVVLKQDINASVTN
jgi:hypothetical protein